MAWNSKDGMVAARYLPTRSGGQEDRLVRLKELIRELLNEAPAASSNHNGRANEDLTAGSPYYADGLEDAASVGPVGPVAYGKASQPATTMDGYRLMKRILLRQLANNNEA